MSYPPFTYVFPGILCGGSGGGLQQALKHLSQPDPRFRCHADRTLPNASHRCYGELSLIYTLSTFTMQ